MGNALIGGTIVAVAAGLIGYFVVVRQTAFAAHALAHIGLPGATGAVLLGVPVAVGLGVFCVGGALVIGVLGKRAADREVVTGTVLSMAIGLGLFFNSLATKSSSTMTNVLFGNLLAISHDQLIGFAILLVVLGLSVGIIYRPLLFTSVNALVAEAKGVQSIEPSPPRAVGPAEPCTMVIFGANGDMTKRLLMPALYNLARTSLLPEKFALIGVDLAKETTETWRDHLYQILKSFVGNAVPGFHIDHIDEVAWK
ncbi:MAG: metal ABC transporter permease, partial [Mycobacterium sp.]